jgi:hypothetical protein
MNPGVWKASHWWPLVLATLFLTFIFASGCRNHAAAARTDEQIASDIQARIAGEGALAGQDIQVSVDHGIATLSGSVSNEASRALAGNDSGAVAGVKTVVNNLEVQLEVQSAPRTAAAPAKLQPPRLRHQAAQAAAAPRQAPAVSPQPQADMAAAPPPPPPPPAPPKPVVKQIMVQDGTSIPVRISEALSSKDSHANDAFHGSLASDLYVDGVMVFRQGTPILGRVVDAKEAAHFKGSALLSLELTQITADGKKIPLVTDAYSQQGSGRGKNTVEKAGGGGVLGAIIGGIAGGGKGAAIGTLAGAAAGTGANGVTRGKEVTIPSETLINFRLQTSLMVTVTIPPAQSPDNGPTLEHRQ